MNKNCSSFGGKARLLIQHGCSLLLHLCQGCINIFHFEADVVQALAALLQELCQAGVGIDWLDQFDFTATRATHGEEGDAYLLGRYLFYLAGGDAKGVPIEE